MAFTFGFHNAQNGDREYNAIQISRMFDGLIADGVFATYGDGLLPSQADPAGMSVNIGTGRAWLKHTWSLNDSVMNVPINAAELVLNRIDTIVLEVDNNVAARQNQIIVIEGTPASTPTAPTLIDAELKKQYPICDVYVGAGVTIITDANITNKVGQGDLPFCTGIIDTINTADLIAQWNDEFGVWFESIKDILDENVAAELLLLIQANESNIANNATTISTVNQNLIDHESVVDIHREITISTSDPSGGSNGDIWIKYTP